jgi:PAS domain S-box-containing protein
LPQGTWRKSFASKISEIAVEAMKRSLDDYVIKSPKHFIRLPAAMRTATKRAKERQTMREAQEALSQSEEKYRSLVDSTEDSIYLVDGDCAYLFVNEKHALRLGLPRDEVMGRGYGEFHSKQETTEFSGKVKAVFETGESLSYEYRSERDGGYYIRTLSPVKAADGEIIAVTVDSKEITAHKQTWERLEHLNALLHNIRKVNQLITREKDRDTLIQGACNNLIEARGYHNAWIALLDEDGRLVTTAEAGLGKDFLPMVKRLRRGELTDCGRSALAQSEVIVTKDPFSTCSHCPLATKYGGRGALTVRLEYGGKICGLLSTSIPAHFARDKEEQSLFEDVARDMAFALQRLELEEKRKRAEDNLRSSQEELRNLADHLQSAREAERTTIAREVHDVLGQALTALKMDISWLSKRLPKDQESLLEKARSISKLTDITIKAVKRISAELRPGLLDDLGLVAAIEWQVEEFQDRTGLTCKFVTDPEDIAVDENRSIMISRILQEALTNVARHAKATRVTVSFKGEAHKWVLRIRDNGKGITEKQISDPKSFGIMGMRERVRMWGGEVKIKGIPDEGTTVTVSIPVDE